MVERYANVYKLNQKITLDIVWVILHADIYHKIRYNITINNTPNLLIKLL